MSVIPVVGDFAAAQQPVIVVLSEGTFMTVQAVVSPDRRFVRLTVVPFFSQIDNVSTFTFTGSQSTTTDTSRQGIQTAPNDNTKTADSSTTTTSGVTVQLPTFSFVTVTTTVSVPDGGTVLLGGIKRLSEGRNEFGVPILNKIPYINRLFKNVGIGRETQSLMMMVTPRIIIQEEEEEKLGVTARLRSPHVNSPLCVDCPPGAVAVLPPEPATAFSFSYPAFNPPLAGREFGVQVSGFSETQLSF